MCDCCDLIRRLNEYSAEHQHHGGICAEAADVIKELSERADELGEELTAAMELVHKRNEKIDELLAENTELKASLNLEKECYQKVYENYIDLLFSAPHWISVEERLPEPEQGVLVYDDCGYMNIASYTHDKYFSTLYEFHVNGEYEPGITHWMPLPAPPTEVE